MGYPFAMVWDAEAAWFLIKADDPAKLDGLQRLLGMSQTEVIDHMIENTCWKNRLSPFVGGKGTPEDRRKALIFAYEHPTLKQPFPPVLAHQLN